MRPGDMPDTFSDTGALEKAIGLKPATSLRQGVRHDLAAPGRRCFFLRRWQPDERRHGGHTVGVYQEQHVVTGRRDVAIGRQLHSQAAACRCERDGNVSLVVVVRGGGPRGGEPGTPTRWPPRPGSPRRRPNHNRLRPALRQSWGGGP